MRYRRMRIVWAMIMCVAMLGSSVGAMAAELSDDQTATESSTDTGAAEESGLAADDTGIQTSENVVTAQEELADTTYVGLDQEQEPDGSSPLARAMSRVLTYEVAFANTDGTFDSVATYPDFDAAKAAMQERSAQETETLRQNSYVVRYNGKVVAMIRGMAAVTATAGGTLSLADMEAGVYPYITSRSTVHYYETESLSRIKVGISGITNYTSYENLLLIPMPFMEGYAEGTFAGTNVYVKDYYSVNSAGNLTHTITTLKDVKADTWYESGEGTTSATIVIDKAPSFMQSGVRYYSVDGCTFYNDMWLEDLAGTYYPYFKYLSYHSQSSYTAAELNTYLTQANLGSGSVMIGQGQAFKNAEDSYGINALMEIAFACLESGYGTSNYAVNRYNLFGINAGDANPDDASYYTSVEACINDHAGRILKQGYFDALGGQPL